MSLRGNEAAVANGHFHNSYCITIASSVALYVVLWRANRAKEALGPEDEAEKAKLAFQDLTDKENPYFRYVL